MREVAHRDPDEAYRAEHEARAPQGHRRCRRVRPRQGPEPFEDQAHGEHQERDGGERDRAPFDVGEHVGEPVVEARAREELRPLAQEARDNHHGARQHERDDAEDAEPPAPRDGCRIDALGQRLRIAVRSGAPCVEAGAALSPHRGDPHPDAHERGEDHHRRAPDALRGDEPSGHGLLRERVVAAQGLREDHLPEPAQVDAERAGHAVGRVGLGERVVERVLGERRLVEPDQEIMGEALATRGVRGQRRGELLTLVGEHVGSRRAVQDQRHGRPRVGWMDRG